MPPAGWRSTRWRMAAIASLLNRTGQRPATDLVLKFLEHFAGISDAMERLNVWDETDGLYYDRLVTPDGTEVHVKARSMVGIIPLLAAIVVDEPVIARATTIGKAVLSVDGDPRARRSPGARRRGLLRGEPGNRHLLLGVVGIDRLHRLFEKLFDEESSCRHTVCGRCPPTTASTRMCSKSKGSQPRSTTSRRNPRRTCSVATPTGGARSGSRSTTCWSACSSATTASSGRTSDRIPDRQRHDAVARRITDNLRTGSISTVPCRPRRSTPVLSAGSSACSTTRTGRTTSCSTNTSTATTAPVSAPSHQTGWTGVVADIIRGRPGDGVYSVGQLAGVLRERAGR